MTQDPSKIILCNIKIKLLNKSSWRISIRIPSDQDKSIKPYPVPARSSAHSQSHADSSQTSTMYLSRVRTPENIPNDHHQPDGDLNGAVADDLEGEASERSLLPVVSNVMSLAATTTPTIDHDISESVGNVEVKKELKEDDGDDSKDVTVIHEQSGRTRRHGLVKIKEETESLQVQNRQKGRGEKSILPSQPQQCQTCLREFDNKYLLLVHIRNDHFECTKCKQLFESQWFLEAHKYKCKKCPQFFCVKADLTEHMDELHGPQMMEVKPGIYKPKCKDCELTFATQKECRKHWMTMHGIKCTRCNCKFSTQKQLERHMERHNYLNCDECGKRFKGRRFLKLHKRRAHSGNSATPCDVCGKQYKQERSLIQHKISHHGAEGKYQCNICDRQFLEKALYDRHMRIHTGEKPYQCSICGVSFALGSSLYIHQQRHSTERKFKCTMCDCSYKAKINLQRHMQLHHPSDLSLL